MKARVSKRSFYHYGGLANPNQYRKMWGGAWTYWRIL